MIVCRLCGLSLEAIPEDAIQCGKLYRFTNGKYHDLRKKLEPRTGPRPRKIHNPDREPEPAPSTPVPVVGRTPNVFAPPEKTVEPETTVDEVPVPETILGRALRLALVKA